MTEPHGADHGVVAALVEEKLAAVAEADVHLAILVYIGRVAETTALTMEVEDGALADVDKYSHVALASVHELGLAEELLTWRFWVDTITMLEGEVDYYLLE